MSKIKPPKKAKAEAKAKTKSKTKTKTKTKAKAGTKAQAGPKAIGKKRAAKASAPPKTAPRTATKAKSTSSRPAPARASQRPSSRPKSQPLSARPKSQRPSTRPKSLRPSTRPKSLRPTLRSESRRSSAPPKSQRPSKPPGAASKSMRPGAPSKSQRPSATPKSQRPSAAPKSLRPSAGWRSLAPGAAPAASLRPTSLRPTSLRPTSLRPTPSRRPPPEPGSFKGFSGSTLRFLKGITEHNDKAWFDAHRGYYENHYLTPALAFINDLGLRLVQISPKVHFEPRVNGSLFRIQRDIRFSKDKTPYKNHIDLWFWHGDRKSWSTPGFFFRLEPQRLTLGAGVHRFDAAQLERYRAAVVHAKRGPALTQLLRDIEAAGHYRIGGEARKTVPKAYASDHPRAPLLLHEGLYASFERRPPALVATPGFVDYCVEHYRALAPLCLWLLAL